MMINESLPHASTPTSHLSPPPFASEDNHASEFENDPCAGFVVEVKQTPSHPLSPPSETSEFERKDIPALNIDETMSIYSPEVKPQEAASVDIPSIVSSPYLVDAKTPMTPKNARACRTILTSIQRHESAWPFKQPVDPVLVGALNYFDIIKSPMDLSTISKRLAHAVYGTVQDFAADFRLMLDNCYTYNPPTHDVHKIGRSLDAHIQAQFTKHFPDITSQPVATVTAPSNTFMMAPPATERKKRNIRPPNVYEPDDIPARKHRFDDSDEISKKRKLNKDLLRRLSEGPVGPELISTLTSAVQNLQEQIAHLQQKEHAPHVARSAAPRPIDATKPKAKSRRKGPKQCTQCKTLESKVWRSGPMGRATLCDSCGLRYSAAKKSKKPLTYEEKFLISKKVGMLSADKQAMIAEIVSRGSPVEGGVVEIDMDKLDNKTLRELYEFVMMQGDEPAGRQADAASDDESDSGESSGSESD